MTLFSNRTRRGGVALLTADLCERILDLKAKGVLQKDIATRFGVSRSTISKVVRGTR